jgi:arginyl-tRNA synthetase
VIRDDLADALRGALDALEVEPRPDSIMLERPAKREHGDWSSNVALATAKKAGRNPRELAQQVADHLNASEHTPRHVDTVDVAGPGFVNFRLHDTWLHDVLVTVVTQGQHNYARHDIGNGLPVNVEFVSANPTGPLHAGGGRWAAYGDSLCRPLERTGHRPHREYYLNDRGVQMNLFAESLAARQRGAEPPEGGYQGEYLVEWAAEMPDGADARAWGYERVKRDLAGVLERMGVRFDTWSSEQALVDSGAVDATLQELRDRGVAYDAEGAVWLRTTEYGDDKDRVLVKSDGEPTYLLPDIAYHRDKFARGFDHLIDVWGADHHGYVPRMKGAIQALGHEPDDLEIVLGQLVNLVKGGEPVRLSKRSGDIVLLADVLDAIGPEAARLTFLLQSIDTRQTIDLDVVASESMENPVHYVRYAHARIKSIERVAEERGVTRRPLDQVDVGLLTHQRELDVLRSLSELPDVVLDAARDRAPHKVTTWVRELAGRFHGFYHDCYVIGEGVSDELTQARLWLVEAARVGLAVGLDLLGVDAPERM